MKSNTLLAEVKTQIQNIKKTAEEKFLSLDSQQLNHKPNSNKWSIAECLEHLNYYNEYYNKQIQIAMETSSEKVVQDFKPTWLGKLSVNAVHPDNAKAIKTKKWLNPAQSKVKPDVVKRFIQHQEELLRLIDQAKQINLNKAKVRIEVMKLFKLPLGDILLFMAAHEQRHTNQALNVLKVTSGVRS